MTRWLATVLFVVGCGSAPGTKTTNAQGFWVVDQLNLALFQPDTSEIAAADARTGATLWRAHRMLTPDPPFSRNFPQPLVCPPVVTSDRHLVLRYPEGVYSIEATTGQILWMQRLAPPALCAAATPDGGVIVITARRKVVTKFDRGGTLEWKTTLPFDAIALTGPSVLESTGDVLIRTNGHLVSLTSKGDVKWSESATSPEP